MRRLLARKIQINALGQLIWSGVCVAGGVAFGRGAPLIGGLFLAVGLCVALLLNLIRE